MPDLPRDDETVLFEDGMPSFNLYLGDFETEAREKVVEDLKAEAIERQ